MEKGWYGITMCYSVEGAEGGDSIVNRGRKEVWEERPRPPNPGWKIVCV